MPHYSPQLILHQEPIPVTEKQKIMATTHNSAKQGKSRTITIDRTFDLPTDIVWKAWTEPESFMKWWGPKDFTCPSCTIDLRVGGKNLACMRSSEGEDFWSVCIFREIVQRKKLVYEDNFADSKGNIVPPSYYDMPGEWGEAIVTVQLEESGGSTRMRLTHEGIPEEMFEDCTAGWEQSLDKLGNKLAA
jgi:uncharacterized protein YndB with AHSA1/START domain